MSTVHTVGLVMQLLIFIVVTQAAAFLEHLQYARNFTCNILLIPSIVL